MSALNELSLACTKKQRIIVIFQHLLSYIVSIILHVRLFIIPEESPLIHVILICEHVRCQSQSIKHYQAHGVVIV